MARFTPRTTEREMRSAWWDIKESEYLGELAVRSTLPRATLRSRRRSLRTAVGEKPPPNVSWSSRLKLLRLTKIVLLKISLSKIASW